MSTKISDGVEDLRIVMLPWSAFGHLIPFFQLSLHLANSGIQISFISTPNNLKRLPQIPSNLASHFKFVEFQLPEVDELPKEAESTVDLPYEKIPYLKTAYDLLQHPFKDFLAKNRIDWIIHDGLPYWTAQIAQIYSIPCILFSVFSASSIVFFGPLDSLSVEGQRIVRPSPASLTSPPDWVSFPSNLAFRSHEAKSFFAGFYGENASGIRDADRLSSVAGGCEIVGVRSCFEFEREYLELLQEIYRKPVIPVGILPAKAAAVLLETGSSGEFGWIFDWLDKQKAKSVVYVSFGSEVKLSREQVHEIAYGLELSGLPFLWAFKKPMWVSGDGDDGLPSDFKQRIDRRQGVVTMGWAPQLEILAHGSIGGSMFHGGWGSILETLQWGHPLVVLPLVIDHGLNARILVEKGLAVEVEMDEETGWFGREDVEKALKKVMVVDEGEEESVIRVKAREMASVFGDLKVQDEYINGFVEYLKNKSNITRK